MTQPLNILFVACICIILDVVLALFQSSKGVETTRVYEWGGQHSFGIPFEVDLSSTAIKQVGFGAKHIVVLTVAGQVYSWGEDNQYGQIGDGTFTAKTTASPILQGKNVVQIAVGGYFSMALGKDNTIYTWGQNTYGQCGMLIVTCTH
jgi:alpha-tubulin suppressor-like RCC1 family protein